MNENFLYNFLESCDATDLNENICNQCLSSPWGDKFDILQYDVDAHAIKNMNKLINNVLKSNNYTYFETYMQSAKHVTCVCLSIIKNSTNTNCNSHIIALHCV